MTRGDWELRYPKREAPTGIYRNKKTGQHIQIGGKQLGSHDNFKVEGFPFEVEDAGHPVRYEKWFKDKNEAIKFLEDYMRTN